MPLNLLFILKHLFKGELVVVEKFVGEVSVSRRTSKLPVYPKLVSKFFEIVVILVTKVWSIRVAEELIFTMLRIARAVV